jgi:serine/threonine protein kinase
MEVFEAQELSQSTGAQEVRAADITQKDHDFLSFLSLFVSIIRDMSTDLQLASILLGPAIDLQDPASRGKFFSITLIEQKELSQSLPVSPEMLNPLPNIVALKAPILGSEANSPRNRQVFSSMAIELQILRDGDLRAHNNIVTLLGVCWQLDSEQQVLPVFVMEATEIGNLKVFLSGRTLTLTEEVSFCIDIASGMSAIHKKGVIHGDIKPENVLVFKKDQDSFIAKICDFGSSILMSTATPTCELPGGTKIWQAPEIHEVSRPEQLRRAEIYSLGLVIWYIFATDIAMAILDCDSILLDANKVSGELLQTAMETLESQHADEWQSTNVEEVQLQQCIISSTLAYPANERWEIDAILACLFELRNMIMCRGEVNSVSEELEVALNLEDGIATEGQCSINLHYLDILTFNCFRNINTAFS